MSFGQGGPQWGPGGPGSQPPEWGTQQGQNGPQQHPQQNPQQGWQSGPQQPQPQWGSGSQTPDWGALAEASEARNRRRKWLMIGGAALATVVVGAAVAIAVVSTNGDDTADKPSDHLPSTADIPSKSSEPDPSFANTTPPPPPDPKDYVSSAKKDKAPLNAGTLFPDDTVTMGERSYKQGGTDDTKSCASVTHGDLGQALDSNHCIRVIRSSYSKGGVAVTVGVAVFDNDTQAAKAVKQTDSGNVLALSGSGISSFCTTAICRHTANSYGRYAYFTVAGFTSGKDVTKGDDDVFAAGDNLAEYTFRQILHRGQVQASAAATE
ncbi:hypothetical protein [Streptomyces odontomachi]|uniref:hypothetical protein n=1 Tax=Streptomyces odontomachi TaxID=2944940 RepID=UPI00210EFD2E|nr:hypothetical protein [Streptomyces sp. ODS25]